MRVSLGVTNFTWPAVNELDAIARQADEGGLDTLWVADHLVQAEPGTEPTDPMLEAYATLGHLTAITERIRLGAMVTAVSFRPPALLVKAVTTIDVLSGGRAWLGLGAGYHQGEATMMGLPLPATAERFEQVEETVRLALQMWSGNDQPFTGTHVSAQNPIGRPLPATRPHPPILIGGAGEQKTLRLVARYAQACNIFDIPDGGRTVRHKLDVLARHCDTENRDPAEIDKTISTRVLPTATIDDITAQLTRLTDLGLDHAVVITSGPWQRTTLNTLIKATTRVA
ncbi:TIGR03560 family F420-dependent LLM class oxidoreductase [Actinoplanes sp. NPDC089786]|uniref:TIGR03560 family F420-dependent LLM class oxidoreductase n=1 Tax=Actinoplanes sp. NPDC089786 TaxID=3155185 RepID=UPI003434AE12